MFAEGHADNVSKRDYQFLHYLAMFDSRMHIGELRRAAARDFPNTPLTELVVLIDQSVVPPKYGVKELKAYTLNDHVVISENEEARNRALIEKAQAHPDKYTIVDMTIAGGDALNKVMTLATGGFWSLDSAVPHATPDTEKVRRQRSFENTLRWVFQAVDELDQSDLRRRMRRLGVKVSSGHALRVNELTSIVNRVDGSEYTAATICTNIIYSNTPCILLCIRP